MDDMITQEEIKEIENGIYNEYYKLGGEKISATDPLNILFKTLTYLMARQQGYIRYLASQNYISTATGSYLDKLGEFVGVKRNPAESSVTTIRFTRVEGYDGNILIPQGTRTTKDSKIFFATTMPATLPDNASHVDVISRSLEIGSITAGFPIDSIRSLVDPISFIKDVANISISSGGRDIESDDEYRAILLIAPESLSSAGPRDAYKAYAKKAYQGVADVEVLSSTPGVVEIYPLLEDGVVPSVEILIEIEKSLSADSVRPLTDKVEVIAPIELSFDIDLKYYLYQNSYTKEDDVLKTVDNYLSGLRKRLGIDIVIDDLIVMLKSIGVKRVELFSSQFIKVERNQLPVIDKKIIEFGGFEDE